MTKVLLDMAISLDGFVASAPARTSGSTTGISIRRRASAAVVDELVETTGAIVIGRGAFGTGEDAGLGRHALPTSRISSSPTGRRQRTRELVRSTSCSPPRVCARR